MKKPSQHLIAEAPRKRGQVELTIGIDLGRRLESLLHSSTSKEER